MRVRIVLLIMIPAYVASLVKALGKRTVPAGDTAIMAKMCVELDVYGGQDCSSGVPTHTVDFRTRDAVGSPCYHDVAMPGEYCSERANCRKALCAAVFL